MKFFSKYGIGLMVFVAWIIQAVPVLTTPPKFTEIATTVRALNENTQKTLKPSGELLSKNPSNDSTIISAAAELRRRWIMNVVLIVAGIVSSILSIFRVRFWWLAIVSTSLIYLFVWYSYGSLSSVSPITAFQLKWMTAKVFGLETNFFIKDVILPIFYLAITVFLIFRKTMEYLSKERIAKLL
jgi:hypothetical protein